MTSNCFGLRTSGMAQLSAYICDNATSAYSASCSFCTSWRQSTPDSMTLAFSAEHNRIHAHGLVHGGIGERHPMRIDGGAADQILLDVEAHGLALVEPADD